MTDRETAHQIRGLVSRGVMTAANDGGETQTADVTMWAGIERTGIEVIQPFGVASVAPAGGTVVLLAVGGDQGDLVALPVGSPAFRLGKLGVGDSALYSLDGSRVICRADGSIEVTATRAVTVKVPGVEAEISSDRWRLRRTDGKEARIVADADHLKMRRGAHWIAITDDGIRSSAAITVGADPHPDV